jgi:hypothetical protein
MGRARGWQYDLRNSTQQLLDAVIASLGSLAFFIHWRSVPPTGKEKFGMPCHLALR